MAGQYRRSPHSFCFLGKPLSGFASSILMAVRAIFSGTPSRRIISASVTQSVRSVMAQQPSTNPQAGELFFKLIGNNKRHVAKNFFR
jgi:hypothetical protein